MISQVSANENVSEVNDNNYGDFQFKELSPVYASEDAIYIHYPIGVPIYEDVFYDGIKNVNEENLTDSISINSTVNLFSDKVNPDFKIVIINRTSDGNATLLLNSNPNATGFIVFSFLENQKFNLTNGSLTYNFNNLEKGRYSIDFYYSGDETFANGTYKNIIFKMPSFKTEILPQRENFTIYYKNGTTFVITLLDDLNRPLKDKSVKFRINKQIYTRQTDSNGQITFPINLNVGSYLLETVFYGSATIGGCSYNTTISILPTLEANDLVKIYKNDSQYLVKVLDGQGNLLVNKTIQFNINGVFYNRTTNDDGIAKLNINLSPGNYIITAENLNDGFKISNNVSVLPSILSNDLVKIYKNDSQFYVQLINGNGTPLANAKLQMNINGVMYYRITDSDGKAKLNINLGPGDFIITIENLNDGCIVSNHIRVTPYLFTQDLVKYYKNESQFEAKLVDESYNPIANHEITFDVNGVKYVRTTNSQGIATLRINLSPGYYDIVTSNNEYVVSNKIKVLNTILMPKNYVKGEFIDWVEETPDAYIYSGYYSFREYPVKILDGNGNPYANQSVIFNVDGKDYQRTTNDNGIASVNAIDVDGRYHLIKTYYNGYFVQQHAKMVIIY